MKTSFRARGLEALVRQAGFALTLERLWPFLVALALLAGVFVFVSFAGLWLVLPAFLRGVGLGLFGLAVLALFWRATRFKPPLRREALRKIDADSGQTHAIAAAMDDRPATPDAAGSALWAEHRARLLKASAQLQVAPPRLNLAARDPYALRFLIVLLVFASCFIAGPEKEMRLRAAFDVKSPVALTAVARLDGWLLPPAYTHRPSVLVFTGQFNVPSQNAQPREFSAPSGSVLHIRGGLTGLTASGGLVALENTDDERQFTLKADAELAVSVPSGSGRLVFHAIPDLPPEIRLLKAERLANGKLRLVYKTDDDYGVVAAEVRFSAGTDITDRNPLVPPPILPLPIAPHLGIGEMETTVDVSDHPWAGADTQMVLVARDAAGHEAFSVPQDIVLPQIEMNNPLARALMEQRLHLVLEPNLRQLAVQVALDGLLLAPEDFPVAFPAYLGLREAYLMLRKSHQSTELLVVAQMLHDVALDLENQGRSPARRQLKAAERALRDAVKNGASPEEIARLTQNLREALAQVLREEANKPPQSPRSSRDARAMTPEDLKDMLDRLEDMAKSGQSADVEAMLDQLDQLTEHMQADGDSPDASPREHALDTLDQLSQDQQNLRDKTYRNGLQPPDAPSSEALKNGQRGLRQKLESLKRALTEAGEAGEPALDAAEDAMKQSEQALDANKNSSALEAQGKALEQLRHGAQNLTQRDGEQKDGQGKSQTGSNGKDPLGRGQQGTSKLTPSRGNGPLTGDAGRRVQDIFREIQRRAGENQRPIPERNYLDRLLRDF
eukprot:gene17897-18129_t